MTRRDALRILGVENADDARSAYRRLVMKWHPDRNDSPDAAARFREVREAYERLTGGGERVPYPGDNQYYYPERNVWSQGNPLPNNARDPWPPADAGDPWPPKGDQ